MKQIFVLLLLSSLAAPTFAQSDPYSHLRAMAAVEHFPDDTFLDRAPVKRAMVITAHDDDACAMYGTLARLHAAGWEVRMTCFKTTDAKRDERHSKAVAKVGATVDFLPMVNREYRRDLPANTRPYLPIAKSEYPTIFDREKVLAVLLPLVQEFDPAVVFTLDDEIGGYGHPEHVFISIVVRELFEDRSISATHLYQSVYTDQMEQAINGDRMSAKLANTGHPNTYLVAKEVYGVSGMPEPNTQVDIQAQAEAKMAVLRAYGKNERDNIDKFVPEFQTVKPDAYFQIFNREFFRVLVAH